MNNTKILTKKNIGVQTLATLLAIVGAVAVPQVFHVIGAVSGLGTSLGETFLPMHLPIILVGLMAGPVAGGVAGLLGPLASFALTGMPTSVMLPFMMVELCIYGLSAGLLKNIKMPSIAKVLISQVAGRLVRMGAIAIAVYVFGKSKMNPLMVLSSVKVGLFGLVLQWSLIPLIMYRVNGKKTDE